MSSRRQLGLPARAAIALAIALALGACEAEGPAGAARQTAAGPASGGEAGATATPAPGSRLGAFEVVPGVALSVGRSEHTSHVLGSSLYVIGGLSGERTPSGMVSRAALDGVERAAIASDGSLGAFSPAERVRLTVPRFGHCSVVVGSYLYVLGGMDAGFASLNTVERAVINTNGVLGPFVAEPEASLAVPRYGAACQVIGDHLYVMGGDGDRQTTTERAFIRDDGTLGPFELVPAAQVGTGRVFAAAHLLGSFLYVLGGDEENRTERAVFSPGGLGTFTPEASASLSEQRGSATSHVVGDSLYVLGGWSGLVEKTLERAAIGRDNGLGAFVPVTETTLSGPSMRHTSHVVGRTLYVIGGSDDGQRALKRVERAKIE